MPCFGAKFVTAVKLAVPYHHAMILQGKLAEQCFCNVSLLEESERQLLEFAVNILQLGSYFITAAEHITQDHGRP